MTAGQTDQLGPLPAILREGGGQITSVVAPTGDRVWLVRDYALARLVLTDKRFSRAEAVRPDVAKFNDAEPAADSMMSMDGAAHARLRHIVAGAFTTRKVAALTPQAERLTGELLDQLASAGPPADVVSGLATPLALTVLCTLLGIPAEDHKRFQDWVEVLFDISRSTPEQKSRRRLELVDYMADLMALKRTGSGDDVLATLIRAHDQGNLSEAEMVTMGLTLLTAGYETTVGQIGLALLALLCAPGPRQDLHERPESLAQAVEELLRLSPSTPLSFPRVTVEPVLIGQTRLNAGETVVVSLLHGNRDARVFAAPSRMLPGERESAHLTFGHGTHRCLGASLARAQVQIALAGLLERFPALRLAPRADAVAWKDGLAIRGLTRLLVTW